MSLLYVNLPSGNSFIDLQTVFLALIIGLFLGCMASFYSRIYLGRVVRALLREGALSPENAKTLDELKIKASPLMKHALRDGTALRKHAVLANGEECKKEVARSAFFSGVLRIFGIKKGTKTVMDFTCAAFFVPENKRHGAEVKYESRGNPAVFVPIAIVLFAALAAGIVFGMPHLLNMLDSIITTFKNL